ncbi:FG-GAP-like repeat-containing protein [Aureisphaera galaxeae]|uniref:FG-GAP-like repeat-containing protein n=1 Tax=Aureisphaera galaxeae TaxID=1538023 RepID=UPI002350F703|nr:FG-GAP-like repeat-containing protein [Aureisphaera galaxeae]MDC8002851.1 FG-GAP-like repeat-containing protein [Aureisphaera galaxeae]
MNLKNTLIALILCVAPVAMNFAQSFQETSIPDLTTTPSASRSANFVDVNGDGWDDIFITNGPFAGQDNMLYINNQNNTFTTVTVDDIVSDGDRSDGASFADADNDGDLDVFVVTFGASGVGKKNYFYRNNGDGSFTYEPTIAMGIPLTYSEMATWIDANDDQNLDLYFTNSVGSLQNMYFENLGDGSFQQETSLSITDDVLASRSIDWIDYDGDGDCDLFVTNEEGQTNSLFRNDGPDNFTQIFDSTITLSFRNSAGSSWGDIDNDGDFDLFVANYGSSGQANQLYINDNGTFTEDTASAVAVPSTSSFGSSFADVDNDGDLDLFVCNAFLAGQNNNFLYINDGNGNFTQDTSSDLANHSGWTFGCAFGDYNNDGWLDALLANTLSENQTNSLYENTGTGNNWVKLHCQGTDSNYSAVGAVVKILATINGNPVWQTRKIAASSGYCSQNSYTVHFGLGNSTSIDEVIVEWPVGTTEIFDASTTNQTYDIIEGEGTLGNIDTTSIPFSVYPNPAAQELTVQLKHGWSSDVEAIVYATNGQKIITSNTEQGNTKTIDVAGLSQGVYFIQLFSENRILGTAKFVKE